jgi:hypothetical protein
MSDRYYVITCTGFLVTVGRPSGSRAPGLTASVLDRLWNHREMARFRSEDRVEGGHFGKTRKNEGAIEAAERVCRELNEAAH